MKREFNKAFLAIVAVLVFGVNVKNVYATCRYAATWYGNCLNGPSCQYSCDITSATEQNWPLEKCLPDSPFQVDTSVCPSGWAMSEDDYECDSKQEALAFCGSGTGGGGYSNGCTVSLNPTSVNAGQTIGITVGGVPNNPAITGTVTPSGKCNGMSGSGGSGGTNCANNPDGNCSGSTTASSNAAGTCTVTAHFAASIFGPCAQTSDCAAPPPGGTVSCNTSNGTCNYTEACQASAAVNCTKTNTYTYLGVAPIGSADQTNLNNPALFPNGTSCASLTNVVYGTYQSGNTPPNDVLSVDQNNIKAICVKGKNDPTGLNNIKLQDTTSGFGTIIKDPATSNTGYAYRIDGPSYVNNQTHTVVASLHNQPAVYCNAPDASPAQFIKNGPAPDLIVTALTIPSGNPGQVVSGSVTVQNTPSATAPTGGTFSILIKRQQPAGGFTCTTTQTVGTDVLLTNIGPLAIGQSVTPPNFSITLPSSAGPYTAEAMVNNNSGTCPLFESTTANNTKTAGYSVVAPSTAFFRGLGGDITAFGADSPGGKVTDSHLTASNYISENSAGGGDAGSVIAKSTTAIDPGLGIYSHQGASPGWNLQGYTNKAPLPTYSSFYQTVLQNAGIWGVDLTGVNYCGAAGNNFTRTVSGGTLHFYCYTNNNLHTVYDSILDTTSLADILIPNPSNISPDNETFNPGATNDPLTNKKMIIFVPKQLIVKNNFTVTSPALATFVVGNDVILQDGASICVSTAITRLDGYYLFGADSTTGGGFCSGVDTGTPGGVQLLGTGALIGLSQYAFTIPPAGSGGQGLQRSFSTGGAAGEQITFNGAYLDLFKNILARPKFKWAEVAPTFAAPTPVPDSTPPSVPTGLATTSVTSSQVGLKWDASTDNVGVTGYEVWRGGAKIGTSGTNSYTDLTVSPLTTYSYQVLAYDAANNKSVLSTPALSVTTPAACTPSNPSAVTLTSPASGATFVPLSTTLNASITTWGTKCPQPNSDQFSVYFGNNPPPLATTQTKTDTQLTSSYSPALSASTSYTTPNTYYWHTDASNGQNSQTTTARSFTTCVISSTGTCNANSQCCSGTCNTGSTNKCR